MKKDNLINPFRLAIMDFLVTYIDFQPDAIPKNYDISVTRRLLPYLGVYVSHWKGYDPFKFGGSKRNRSPESLAQRRVHKSMYNIWRNLQTKIPFEILPHKVWVIKVIQYENYLREKNGIAQIPGYKVASEEEIKLDQDSALKQMNN